MADQKTVFNEIKLFILAKNNLISRESKSIDNFLECIIILVF